MRLPSAHDSIVARLVADVRPVRRLWPPVVRLAVWVVIAATVLVLAARVSLRGDVAGALGSPRYVLELGLLAGAAAAAAAAALLAAIPGRDPRPVAAAAALLAALSATTFLVEPAAPGATWFAGFRCAACIPMFGLVPWLALIAAVARGAPLDARGAGAYVGAAAFLIGAAAVRLACPVDDGHHLLVWHVLPVVAWTGISVLATATWLARRAVAPGPARS
ncbi:MAG TPA: NrsF family protein [Candidatus Binatia bacterium]|nr:NrsF family protein [Candidatus Binatia bacterium]